MTEPVIAAGSSETAPAPRTEVDVRETVRSIVVELSPAREEPEPDAPLIEGLGYSSLSLIELAFTLEDEFDLSPIEEATARLISTAELVEEHVVRELRARGGIVDG